MIHQEIEHNKEDEEQFNEYWDKVTNVFREMSKHHFYSRSTFCGNKATSIIHSGFEEFKNGEWKELNKWEPTQEQDDCREGEKSQQELGNQNAQVDDDWSDEDNTQQLLDNQNGEVENNGSVKENLAQERDNLNKAAKDDWPVEEKSHIRVRNCTENYNTTEKNDEEKQDESDSDHEPYEDEETKMYLHEKYLKELEVDKKCLVTQAAGLILQGQRDLGSAQLLMNSDYKPQTIVMLQQAIEKTVKAQLMLKSYGSYKNISHTHNFERIIKAFNYQNSEGDFLEWVTDCLESLGLPLSEDNRDLCHRARYPEITGHTIRNLINIKTLPEIAFHNCDLKDTFKICEDWVKTVQTLLWETYADLFPLKLAKSGWEVYFNNDITLQRRPCNLEDKEEDD